MRPSPLQTGRLLALIGLMFVTIEARAQLEPEIQPLYSVFYRPLGLEYNVLERGAFEVIYQEGRRQQAMELLWTLETSLAGIDSLLGSPTRFKLPVILNDFSDDGNGFVTTFPFKSEIESVAIGGKSLSRRHRSWTELVAAHELVHAAQGDFRRGLSTTGFFRLFAPDFARTLNLFMPPGITEGLAVFYESGLSPGAGRLNHPYFNMQFRAAMDARGGLSMAQLLEAPSFTRPYDSYYQAGSHFMQFMVEEYGGESIRRMMLWQQQMPFLGIGPTLKYATGDAPWTIGRKFRERYLEANQSRLVKMGPPSESRLLSGKTGQIHRRPRWLTNNELIVYSLGYDLPRGFRQVDIQDGSTRTITRHETSEDAEFSLSGDGSSLFFSRYVPDPLSPLKSTAKTYKSDILTGKTHFLPGSDHAINPMERANGNVVAIRLDGQFNHIVEFDATGTWKRRTMYPRSSFVALLPHPESDSLVAILKVGRHQALFRIDTSKEEWTAQPWIGFQEGSVLDASWSADGETLLFTADMSGQLNIHALDVGSGSIRRITNVPYGAMEAALSPDNSQVAFVEYRDETIDLKLMTFEPTGGELIPAQDARYTDTLPWLDWLTVDPTPDLDVVEKSYNAWSTLAPRMVYPTIYLDQPRRTSADARLGLGVGLAVQGGDLMQRLGFYGEGFVRKERFWGEAGISSAHFPVLVTLSTYHRATVLDAEFVNETGPNERRRVIRDRSGISLNLTLPITLKQNVSRTIFQAWAGVSRSTGQFVDDNFDAITSKVDRWTFFPALYYGTGLVQNARDLVPTEGASLRWFAEYDLYAEGVFANRGWVVTGNLYLPFLRSTNTGIRLNAAFLRQNSSSIFNMDFFKPQGREATFVPRGDHLRYGLELTQPIWFPDNGATTIPLYFRALYLYGSAEYMHPSRSPGDGVGSVSGGAGLLWRLFYNFNFELKIGAAWLPDQGRFEELVEWY